MEKLKSIFQKFLSLKWYYQLAIALASTGVVVLLVKFLIWIVPIITGILMLLFVFTEGEIFSTIWESYKQRKQAPTNPFFMTVYHYLTEQGVSELPVSTLECAQGVERFDENQEVFLIHLGKEISDELFADFETKVRREVKVRSNGYTDCVVSRFKREPFLAIKVRLVSTNEMMLQNQQVEEDF
ncbi:hypothetical protein [Streptococcus suis]|uniref:hypothetical protein n=1 Tax=Streptococcus suis TaxID=1307 RepID=UPI002A79FEBB|nr:hypothetical protein [Streptococcus suis]